MVIVLLGIPVYFVWNRFRRRGPGAVEEAGLCPGRGDVSEVLVYC